MSFLFVEISIMHYLLLYVLICWFQLTTRLTFECVGLVDKTYDTLRQVLFFDDYITISSNVINYNYIGCEGLHTENLLRIVF